ncbi:alpha/beta hydrolase [Candidatus Puniceispirillum marinum IMCC1322]|uniref:Alpha/beta hydrolase n=2 Tax=Candidatus Puniceispirillum TaxID=767891 RepID=D5BNM8_PUNMI|nr:alpha/beta hydrolase [Candidatus Puniceispirillum marinum IMCC1322]
MAFAMQQQSVVLLPGMMCDARLFTPQIKALSASYAVSVADLTQHDSIAAMAASVLAHAPHNFALAGLSMGGIVAMEIMRLAPERVTRLALLDTNPLAEAETMKAKRVPQIAKAKAGALHEIMRHEMKPNYLADGPDRAQILDLCMDMAIDLGVEAFVNQSIALRDRQDQQEILKQITVPTLVMCGAKDTLCPIERHQLMHELITGSRFEIVDGAGHLPTLEQANNVNTALWRWLEE